MGVDIDDHPMTRILVLFVLSELLKGFSIWPAMAWPVTNVLN